MKKAVMGVMAAMMTVMTMGQAAETPKTLKVLMIGNSFSLSCRTYLPKVAASVPGCDLKLEIAYIGGCSLERHVSEYEKSAKDPKYRPYGDFAGKSASLQELLQRDRWDVISIQQASHESWRPESYRPWADKLIAIIRQTNPQAEIIVQQTWSYNSGDQRIHDASCAWKIDQTEMYNRLAANYKKLAEDNGFRVVPVGLAVQFSREDHPQQLPVITMKDWGKYTLETVPPTQDMVGGGYRRSDAPGIRIDMIHLNAYGEYLQACVWFGFLFQRPVSDVPYYPAELPDRARLEKARKCAQKALDAYPQVDTASKK